MSEADCAQPCTHNIALHSLMQLLTFPLGLPFPAPPITLDERSQRIRHILTFSRSTCFAASLRRQPCLRVGGETSMSGPCTCPSQTCKTSDQTMGTRWTPRRGPNTSTKRLGICKGYTMMRGACRAKLRKFGGFGLRLRPLPSYVSR